MLTDTLFKNKKPNGQRLLAYGFSQQDSGYTYTAGLLEGQFEMLVTVLADGRVTANVFDALSGDEYVLHRIPGSGGAFVGTVKAEYEAVLSAVSEACFDRDVFKSESAKAVIQYVRMKYQDELEYLWERFPNNAIWRRSDNAKWYGALLTVPQKKIFGDSPEIIEIIDLRIDPQKLEHTIDGKRYFPGYHMNKKHWFTICLDGSVPVEEICGWIDLSYRLAAKK